MAKLKRVQLAGFKSIERMDLELDRVNLLLGVNGAGKSNVVSFFQMLNMMMTGNLQLFIGRSGGANSLLHYGAKRTLQMEATLEFELDDAIDTYYMRLTHGSPDTLIFTDETVKYQRVDHGGAPFVHSFGAGHKESALDPLRFTGRVRDTLSFIRGILSRLRMFQFHDTSPESYFRQRCRVDDSRSLRHNGGNVAAVLRRLRDTEYGTYIRIVNHIRDIVARFDDFVLEPDPTNTDWIMLKWKEKDSPYDFGAHQLSDGSLRAIALTTLLCLPSAELPSVIVIDEPELGLHPAAVEKVADMMKAASETSQILIATQSMTLVDNFDLDNLIICDRINAASQIGRRIPIDIDGWVDEYTVGKLWQSRAIGGWPQ